MQDAWEYLSMTGLGRGQWLGRTGLGVTWRVRQRGVASAVATLTAGGKEPIVGSIALAESTRFVRRWVAGQNMPSHRISTIDTPTETRMGSG